MNDSQIPSGLPPVLADTAIVGAPHEIVVAREIRSSHIVSYCLSWAVIVALVAMHALAPSFTEPEIRHEATKVDLLQVNLMAKFMLGLQKLSPNSPFPLTVPEFSADDFPEPHWCNAILLNELEGADAGLDHMEETRKAILENRIALTAQQGQLSDILTRLFTDYSQGDWSATTVTLEERTLLTEQLGFSGTLALTPKQGPNLSERGKVENGAVAFTVAALVIFLLVGLTLLVGGIFLCLFLAGVVAKKLRFRFSSGTGRGHIYAETFAVWFVLFTIMQVVVGMTVPNQLVLIALGFGFFGSLAALVWPVARGISWSEVRRDIGWRRESNLLMEVVYGIVAYVSLTPLIMVSILFVVVLAEVFGLGTLALIAQLDGKNAPSHPIVFELAKNEPQVLITALLLACIAAPLIEETMFRGVLYRHLRDSTAWFRGFVSVVLSAGVNALIFAAIHPQGLLGIPVLGTLAFGFSIVREWRDSLIASMTMHAINNGTMTLLLLLVLNSLG